MEIKKWLKIFSLKEHKQIIRMDMAMLHFIMQPREVMMKLSKCC